MSALKSDITTWLQTSTAMLTEHGIDSARLDALLLLEDEFGRDRAWLLAHDDTEISPAAAARLKNVLKKRVDHVPMAYIRGRAEFYGRSFKIGPHVLVPRPESEAMITQLKQLVATQKLPVQASQSLHIVDVGTGSGCLGITAVLEVPNSHATLVDIDQNALENAQINVDLFTANASVCRSDYIASVPEIGNVLLCNLPYVPTNHPVNAAAQHEPAIALFAGTDGLDAYRTLYAQLAQQQKQPLYILTESLPAQHIALATLSAHYNYQCEATDGLIQVFRSVSH